MFKKLTLAMCVLPVLAAMAAAEQNRLASAIDTAGENAAEIRLALETVPVQQQRGMQFLIEHMPEPDLRSLTAAFLLENVDLAYLARGQTNWEIPEDIFFNNVLPYASINESRDNVRRQFYERFRPLVSEAKSPGEAAAILNNKVFKDLGVKYSRKRRRADQGPIESMRSGLASCTGLSVLLIDACRSVGVPARFVGTPLWADRSGNHSWVEVWDAGWHFTGAAEPTGMELDKGWFIQRSSTAIRDDPMHAIYATSYKQTPIHFPMVWNRSIKYVHAVNVTDRYAGKAAELPDKHIYAMFQIYGPDGERCCTPIRLRDKTGKLVFEGKTKDERFDGNDHVTVALPVGQTFELELDNGRVEDITIKSTGSQRQLFSLETGKED